MPIEGIPKDASQSVIEIDGREIRVSIAAVGSHEVKADAFLTYSIDPEALKESEAVRSVRIADQYVAVLGGAASGTSMIEQVIRGTEAAIRLMSRDGVESVVLPMSDILRSILGIDDNMLVNSALIAIREYAVSVIRDKPDHTITDFMIAASAEVYRAWSDKEAGLDTFLHPNSKDRIAIPLTRKIETSQAAPEIPDDTQERRLGAGAEIVTLDERQMKLNSAFVRQALKAAESAKLTMNLESIESISFPGIQRLAAWLSKRSPIPYGDLEYMITSRLYGERLYDVSVAESGQFIGMALRIEGSNAPRGTIRSVGVNDGREVAGRGKGIRFREYVSADGTGIEVPVGFERWLGRKGTAALAFDAWFRSELFERARSEMNSNDEFSRIAFADAQPSAKINSFLNHLSEKKRDRRKVEKKFLAANALDKKSGKAFDDYLAGLDRAVESEKPIDETVEVRIAFLEMLMREALGDRTVDGIIGSGSPSGGCDGSSTPQGGGKGLEGAGPAFGARSLSQAASSSEAKTWAMEACAGVMTFAPPQAFAVPAASLAIGIGAAAGL